MSVNESLLSEVVRRVLAVARHDKIILFGSAASGQMTRDSDLDLLVVEPELSDPRARSVSIRRALGDVEYPVDVIVMSSERFNETRDIIGGIAYPAHRYGRILLKPSESALHGLVVQWLEKAAADFDVAEFLFTQNPGQPRRFGGIIAFHCQQAVEKYHRRFWFDIN